MTIILLGLTPWQFLKLTMIYSSVGIIGQRAMDHLLRLNEIQKTMLFWTTIFIIFFLIFLIFFLISLETKAIWSP